MQGGAGYGRQSRQHGMVLFLVMVFLLITATLVLTAGRSALMGESVSRNVLDRSLAAQAAEAALNDGLRELYVSDASAFNGGACTRPNAQRPLFAYAFLAQAPMVGASMEGFNPQCRRGLCDWTSDGTSYASYSGGRVPWNDPSIWNNSQGSTDKQGRCASGGNAQSTSDFIGGVPLGTFTGAASVPGVWRQPEYMIEVFKNVQSPTAQTNVFRISARGFGADTRTEVLLQMVMTGMPGGKFQSNVIAAGVIDMNQ